MNQLSKSIAMTSKRVIVAVMLISMLSACGTFSAPVQTTLYDREGLDIVVEHETGMTVLIKDAGSLERVCRSSGPDFIAGRSESISVSALAGRGIGGGENFDAAVAGGRSPGLLALREILYRACELSLNLNADKQLSLEIYKQFLASAIEASKALSKSRGSVGEVLNGSAPALTSNTGTAGNTDSTSSADSTSGNDDTSTNAYTDNGDSGTDGSDASTTPDSNTPNAK